MYELLLERPEAAQPDLMSYELLLMAICGAGDLDLGAWARIGPPSSPSISSASAHKAHCWPRRRDAAHATHATAAADSILSEMRERHLAPRTAHQLRYLETCFKQSLPDRALTFLQSVRYRARARAHASVRRERTACANGARARAARRLAGLAQLDPANVTAQVYGVCLLELARAGKVRAQACVQSRVAARCAGTCARDSGALRRCRHARPRGNQHRATSAGLRMCWQRLSEPPLAGALVEEGLLLDVMQAAGRLGDTAMVEQIFLKLEEVWSRPHLARHSRPCG